MAAYVISELSLVRPDHIGRYLAAARPSIDAFGGRYLASSASVEMLEGDDPPVRIVVVEFPTVERARAWYASDEYAVALRERPEALERRLMLVDGKDGPAGVAPGSILRSWTGTIRSADSDAYTDYVRETGLAGYAATPGNLGHHQLLRDLGDGRSEVTTMSWWTSMDAIRGFAGADPERAKYFPDDDRFLLDRPELVRHDVIVDATGPVPSAKHGAVEPSG